MLGSHAVGNLHRAIGSWRPLETAPANHGAAGPMHQHKTMDPGIGLA